jgi:hypothetical protein
LYRCSPGGKTLEKNLSLFSERDHFSLGAMRIEIIASFIKAQQKRAAPSAVPKPRIGYDRCLIPR